LSVGFSTRSTKNMRAQPLRDLAELILWPPLAWAGEERNDSITTGLSSRPPAHLRVDVNSSRRRCTRCRSKVSARICDHDQGCSKCRRRHSSRSLSMAASSDRRPVISASTFLRSTRMSVAPVLLSRFGGRRRPSAPGKAIGPGKSVPGPTSMTNYPPEGRGEGRY
jgi:hypothetical protein